MARQAERLTRGASPSLGGVNPLDATLTEYLLNVRPFLWGLGLGLAVGVVLGFVVGRA